ncbi:MAG: choice-of-anchor tandem repeat GloVer-containing protein [Verrucomicrobiota bacterium]
MKTKYISQRSTFVAVAILSFACLTAVAQDYRVLHHFAGGTNDGATPFGDLIQSGPILYGTTSAGGTNGSGTIFQINTDNNNFKLLHSFAGGTKDGAWPWGSLLLSGSTLYGMTCYGGISDNGTVFQINTDGSGYWVMHKFADSEGMWPFGCSLIQSGTNLYGTCTAGGIASGWDGYGTVFSISTNTNNTVFTVLHRFAGAPNDGGGPWGTLLQSGTNFYGTTEVGGSNGYGTVFQINTNGSNCLILHHFTGGSSDGRYPGCSLVQLGSTFYGTTEEGGSSNHGTVFQINTNGTNFSLLHIFTGSTNDGYNPECVTLAQNGAMLYGTTLHGGIKGTSGYATNGNGVVFQINTTNGAFQLLHRFAGGDNDGVGPEGSVLLSGSTLYGMTQQGGSNNLGVIFALDLFPKLAVTLSGTNINLSWSTNYPGFVLESVPQLTGAWTQVPGITGFSATLPVAATSQFFRLVAIPNPNPARLVWIPAGTFLMGSPATEQDRLPDEGPQTLVTLTRGFFIGRYEVTQGEYAAVTGVNPSAFAGDTNRPVERVSWNDATNFCLQLTAQESAAGRLPAGYAYRLPTEAEWEYACRAGTTTRFYYGDDPAYAQLANYAWYDANSGGTTHPAGQKLPNEWGLYDMSGNVWEWCSDWYGPYAGGAVTDPHGPASSSNGRVIRGGSWFFGGWSCRSAQRHYSSPTNQLDQVGFRIVLGATQ